MPDPNAFTIEDWIFYGAAAIVLTSIIIVFARSLIQERRRMRS